MPEEKYDEAGDVRRHNEYTPAADPVSTTLSDISVDEEKTEFTLVTTLDGVPVQALDDIINAEPSPDTFKNPAPVITIDCTVPLNTGITLGFKDEKERMFTLPAVKYSEVGVQRAQSR